MLRLGLRRILPGSPVVRTATVAPWTWDGPAEAMYGARFLCGLDPWAGEPAFHALGLRYVPNSLDFPSICRMCARSESACQKAIPLSPRCCVSLAIIAKIGCAFPGPRGTCSLDLPCAVSLARMVCSHFIGGEKISRGGQTAYPDERSTMPLATLADHSRCPRPSRA